MHIQLSNLLILVDSSEVLEKIRVNVTIFMVNTRFY